ncbi:PilN domain-containing protein [Shewanella sp.]|uniref:PilN domain-containing protein n=1 Tax=Shewanella sp. TaxID=50422 RepID=UPI003A9878C8
MSKTRINLFNHTLLPPKQRLTLKTLGLASAAILLLGGVAIGLMGYFNGQLQADAAQTKAQLASQQTQLAQLQKQLQQHQPNPALQAEVKLQQQELQLKSLLLNELAQREQLKSVGFTEKLQELAKVSNGNIWLTHLHFDEQKMVFEGYGSSPEAVPDWIARLSLTQSYRGKAFASMTMAREEGKPLAFKLTTEAEEKDAQ